MTKSIDGLVESVKAFRQFMGEKYKGEEIRCPYIRKMFEELEKLETSKE